MTRAMLLCAGKSTRLGPLGTQCPKPLLPVCDVPILRYGITNLVSHGITEIVINLHHRGEMIREELGSGADLGADLHYVVEDEILGTGGGLKNALHLLDPEGENEPFISANGKLIFDVDFSGILEAFSRRPKALGMMVVRRVEDALTWGAVDVDESGPWRGSQHPGERAVSCSAGFTSLGRRLSPGFPMEKPAWCGKGICRGFREARKSLPSRPGACTSPSTPHLIATCRAI